jgi:hypothetical protein
MLDRVAQGFQFSYEVIHYLRFSEATRNLLDLMNFAMGFVGLHNILKSPSLEDRDISKLSDNSSGWKQTAFKTADFLGSLSLIFSSMRSGPAVATWNWTVQFILSPEQLERFFGQQGYLPSEKMDRSLAMIAFLLGFPSTLKTIYTIYLWMTTPRLAPEIVEEEEREEREERKPYHIAVYAQDSYLTFKTVSETANRLLRTPHK